MLPNHAPLTIAEQFGTLETLHPGRIDLGLGPGPGHGPEHAVRVAARPDDGGPLPGGRARAAGLPGRRDAACPGVDATPGNGTNVPLYILGSSLFGAKLAAALGLPYAFASHFAPAALHEAVAVYRRAVPAVGAVPGAVRHRRRQRDRGRHARTRRSAQLHRRQAGPGPRVPRRAAATVTDDEADLLLASPRGAAGRSR